MSGWVRARAFLWSAATLEAPGLEMTSDQGSGSVVDWGMCGRGAYISSQLHAGWHGSRLQLLLGCLVSCQLLGSALCLNLRQTHLHQRLSCHMPGPKSSQAAKLVPKDALSQERAHLNHSQAGS